MRSIRFAATFAGLALTAGAAWAASPPPVAWTARYNGPNSSQDRAQDLVVGSSGDVYVIGYADVNTGGLIVPRLTLVKYTPAGGMLWTAQFASGDTTTRGTLLAPAPDGGVYVAGAQLFNDILVLRYDAGGTLMWSRRTPTTSFALQDPTGLEIDSAGNLVVLGPADAGSTLLKYSPAGGLIWNSFVSTGGVAGGGRALAIGADDSVYITGSVENISGFSDVAVWKVTPAGATEWLRTFADPDHAIGFSSGTDVVIGAGGEIVAAGLLGVGSLTPSPVVRAYSSAGDALWTHVAPERGDVAPLLEVDGQGRIVLAGSFGDDATLDAFVRRFEADGTLVGTTVIPMPGGDLVHDLTLDASDAAYVVGTAGFNTAQERYLMAKVAASGEVAWTQSYTGPLAGNDAYAVEVMADRSVFVTGSSITNQTNLDFLTLRLDQPAFGDMNCDGAISVSDIGPFVLVLTNPAEFAIDFPACDALAADLNEDGAVTVSDIGAFVSELTGG